MSLSVDGFSCLGAFGQSAKTLCAAMASPALLVPEVDTTGLSAYFPARALRGSDRFSRLALLGACLALEDASVHLAGEETNFEGWGIVLASGYGPVTPTLEFIDSLEAYGQAMASPLAFSHSVHNIPAAVIAKNLNIAGPCATVCGVETPVASGLLLAWGWLMDERVDHVLFGAVDERTATLARTTERIVVERSMPVNTSRKDYPVADGACFFCLSRDGGGARGRLLEICLSAFDEKLPTWDTPGLRFMSGSISLEERIAMNAVNGCIAYGNLPVAQAFDCAAALEQLECGGEAISIHQDQDMLGIIKLGG